MIVGALLEEEFKGMLEKADEAGEDEELRDAPVVGLGRADDDCVEDVLTEDCCDELLSCSDEELDPGEGKGEVLRASSLWYVIALALVFLIWVTDVSLLSDSK